ncbi:hypothetical protein OT109_10030 [Phycisphaeraceae bacterium D3-23]
MNFPTALLACPFALAMICPLTACSSDDSQAVSHNADDRQPEPEAPETLPITRPNGDIDIATVHNDPFQLGGVAIEGDTLLITVSYGGGAEDHDFTLYWNGITARSFPGQINVQLKHNANGDTAEAYLTETLRFDLSGMQQPLVIHVHGHGADDRSTVQYGER